MARKRNKKVDSDDEKDDKQPAHVLPETTMHSSDEEISEDEGGAAGATNLFANLESDSDSNMEDDEQASDEEDTPSEQEYEYIEKEHASEPTPAPPSEMRKRKQPAAKKERSEGSAVAAKGAEKTDNNNKKKTKNTKARVPVEEQDIPDAEKSSFNWPLLVFIFVFVILLFVLKAGEEAYDVGGSSRSRVDIDYYAVLGIQSDATDNEIKKAYKKLALRWHPDKNPDCEECAVKFQQAAKAYETLGEPDRRRIYDQASAEFEPIPSSTVSLTEENFKRRVLDSNDVWLIQVYSELEPFCRSVAPSWDEAALQLGGLVKFGRINVDKHKSLLKKLPMRIRGYPTVLSLVQDEKSDVFPLAGPYTVPSLSRFADKVFPNAVETVTDETVESFIGGKSENMPKILLLTKKSQPSLLYRYVARKYGSMISFGQMFASNNSPFVNRNGLKNTANAVLVFHGKSETPRMVLKGTMNKEKLFNLLIQVRKSMLIRLTRENYEDVCGENAQSSGGLDYNDPDDPSRNNKNSDSGDGEAKDDIICVALISDQLNKRNDSGSIQAIEQHLSRLASGSFETDLSKSKTSNKKLSERRFGNIQFVLVSSTENPHFVPFWAKQVEGSVDPTLVAMYEKKERFIMFDGKELTPSSVDVWLADIQNGETEFESVNSALGDVVSFKELLASDVNRSLWKRITSIETSLLFYMAVGAATVCAVASVIYRHLGATGVVIFIMVFSMALEGYSFFFGDARKRR